MKSTFRSPLAERLCCCCAIVALSMVSVAAQAQSAGVALEAKQILNDRMFERDAHE